MSTSGDVSLTGCAIFLQNAKHFISNKFQQAELEKKCKWKHPQGTVISVNEVWQHILKYPEVITIMNFVMIQTTLLESRTEKSLQNPENGTNKNVTQSDAYVNNNSRNVVIFPN